jgi:hypothetical protein
VASQRPCDDPGVRHNALHAGEDPEIVRRLIGDNPCGTLVGFHDGRLAQRETPTVIGRRRPG